MKRIISLMSLAVLACGAATAQNTPYKAVVGTYIDASGALAVSDPSTSVAVDLIVEKEQTVVGPYARYAQKFLNMRGSLVDKTVYSLKGVKLAVTGGEDVIADAVPAAEVTETSYMGSASEFAKVLPDRMSATAVSEEEAAANAAQAIFSIRKHRMDLITGEAGENFFGAGLKDALAALDAAEQEYLELFLGQWSLFAVDADFFLHDVQYQGFVGQLLGHFGYFFLLGAAQHCLDTGRDFSQGEGLGDVVVGSQIESGDGVVFGVLGCDEDDGDVGGFAVFLQNVGHFESRDFSHHDIQQQQVVAADVHFQSFFGRIGGIDFVSFVFQIELQDFAQIFFVVYY